MFGKFVAEALGEQIFFKILSKAWEVAKNVFTGEIKDQAREKLKELVNSKGWEDEHLYLLDLADAAISNEKRIMINAGVLLAEEYDKVNGTKSARHFKIIVTFQDKVPEQDRPGKRILEKIAGFCENENEVFSTIHAMGAMHNPSFSFEQFAHSAKTTVFPFLQRKLNETSQSAKCALSSVSRKLEQRTKKRNNIPWWKKIL